MITRLPRVLLAIAALILAVGGVLHAMAFPKALNALGGAVMPEFYANSFRSLWLIDSAALFSLAIILALLAARPAMATRWIVVLLSLIPAATAVIVYYFVGPFFAPHTLVVASVLIVLGGLRFPAAKP
jgi:hypothetical protein